MRVIKIAEGHKYLRGGVSWSSSQPFCSVPRRLFLLACGIQFPKHGCPMCLDGAPVTSVFSVSEVVDTLWCLKCFQYLGVVSSIQRITSVLWGFKNRRFWGQNLVDMQNIKSIVHVDIFAFIQIEMSVCFSCWFGPGLIF